MLNLAGQFRSLFGLPLEAEGATTQMTKNVSEVHSFDQKQAPAIDQRTKQTKLKAKILRNKKEYLEIYSFYKQKNNFEFPSIPVSPQSNQQIKDWTNNPMAELAAFKLHAKRLPKLPASEVGEHGGDNISTPPTASNSVLSRTSSDHDQATSPSTANGVPRTVLAPVQSEYNSKRIRSEMQSAGEVNRPDYCDTLEFSTTSGKTGNHKNINKHERKVVPVTKRKRKSPKDISADANKEVAAVKLVDYVPFFVKMSTVKIANAN